MRERFGPAIHASAWLAAMYVQPAKHPQHMTHRHPRGVGADFGEASFGAGARCSTGGDRPLMPSTLLTSAVGCGLHRKARDDTDA